MKYRGKSCKKCGGKLQEGGHRHGYMESVSGNLRLPTTANPNPVNTPISGPKDISHQQDPNLMNALTDTGLAMDTFSNIAGYFSGIADRKRQNQYDYQQQALLGQMNAMPANDYQPNPYSLYAKYGGKLKHYMPYDMGFSNDAHMGKGDETMHGEMQQGGISNPYFAQEFGERHNIPILAHNGYSIGDPKFVDQYGNPSQPTPAKSLPFTAPNYVQSSDMYSAQGKTWYVDPQTGDTVDVDPSIMNSKRFRNPTDQAANDLAMRSIAKFAGGGKWLQNAVNPAHKGWCTPLSKSTCTGHRRQFALMMKKKHGFQ